MKEPPAVLGDIDNVADTLSSIRSTVEQWERYADYWKEECADREKATKDLEDELKKEIDGHLEEIETLKDERAGLKDIIAEQAEEIEQLKGMLSSFVAFEI